MSSAGVLVGPKERALAQWDQSQAALPGHGLAWLKSRRRGAIERFEELGFPTDKIESWRFTPMAAFVEKPFVLADGVPQGFKSEGLALAQFDAHRLLFVNGCYVPEPASPLPQGVSLGSLAAFLEDNPQRLEPYLARSKGNAFAALNSAFFADGAVLHLAAGVRLEKPVHLLFFTSSSGAAVGTCVRVLIVAQPGSQAEVIEEYAGEGEYFTNAVTEVVVEENSKVELCKLQRESGKAYHVASLQVLQHQGSVFTSHSVALGGIWGRNEIDVRLEGEGADCALNGLYLAKGRQHMDNNTVINHIKPHGSSRELYKGVLDGHSRAVFNGTIVVEQAAQKTSACLYNKNLLLSENGLVNTKPEFKINANDVQCKHGATIGQLPADALFYLRSRGLSPEAARNMLVYAFASEMIERVSPEPLRDALGRSLEERLSRPDFHG